MLDFRVETFLNVCKTMSYTKSAMELAITQPAVSGHIKALEAYYGVKLFEYENKHLKITSEGVLLKNSLETISNDIDKLKEKLQNNQEKESIKIGATKSIGDFVLAGRLSSFISIHPELNVNVCVEDTKKLFAMLDNGELDFIFCEGIINKTDYNYKFLVNETMRAVCSSDYELPKIKNIESLFNERLILREPGSGSRSILEQTLLEKGYNITSFKEICTMNSPAMILDLVKNSCGITFIFDSICKNDLEKGNLKEIKIPNFSISHEFNAVWKKESLFDSDIKAYLEVLCNINK